MSFFESCLLNDSLLSEHMSRLMRVTLHSFYFMMNYRPVSDSSKCWLLFGCVQWEKLTCLSVAWIYVQCVDFIYNFVNYYTCFLIIDEVSGSEWELPVLYWVHDELHSEWGYIRCCVIIFTKWYAMYHILSLLWSRHVC